MTDAAAGKPAIDIDEWGPKIEAFAGVRAERVVAREKAASAAYLAKAAAEPAAIPGGATLVFEIELLEIVAAAPQ